MVTTEGTAASKTDAGNFFEDFTLGQVIEHATPRTITEGDRALYGAIYPSRFAIASSAEFADEVFKGRARMRRPADMREDDVVSERAAVLLHGYNYRQWSKSTLCAWRFRRAAISFWVQVTSSRRWKIYTKPSSIRRRR